MLLLSACIQVTSFFTGPNKAQTADVQTNSQTNGSSLSFKPRGRDFSFGKYYGNYGYYGIHSIHIGVEKSGGFISERF